MIWKKWKRRLLIGLAALTMLAMALVTAVYFILHSPALHRRALAFMIEQAQRSTGARVELRDFDFHWSGLTLGLDHPVLHGTEPAGARPLFAADRVTVSLNVISWLDRIVRLRRVTIDRPSINLIIGAEGRWNLPEPRTGKSPSGTSLFNVGIRYIELREGTIYLNDKRIAVAVALENVFAQTRYLHRGPEYACWISYSHGQVRYGNWNPAKHSLEVQFRATPAGVKVQRFALMVGSSHVLAQGTLDNYLDPRIQATYQASFALTDLGRIMKVPRMPMGTIETRGTLEFSGASGRPILERIVLDGEASSPQLSVDIPHLKTRARLERARYQMAGGHVRVHDAVASMMGGETTSDLTIDNVARRPTFDLVSAIRKISLGEAHKALRDGVPEPVLITGTIDGKAGATWTGAFENLVIKSDLNVTAAARSASAAIPLAGVIHLNYDGARNELALNQSELYTSHSGIQLNGTVSNHSQLGLQAHSDDLHEVDELVLEFRSGKPGPAAPRLLGLGGSAGFNGTLQGRPGSPQFSGQLAASRLQVEGTSWTDFRGLVRLNSSQLSVERGVLNVPSSKGRIAFDLHAALRDWSYEDSSAFSLDASAIAVPLSPLMAFAKVSYPISGMLTGQISFEGTASHPSGHGSAHLTSVQIEGEPLDSVSAQIQGTGDALHSTLTAQARAGIATANLTYYPGNRGYDLHLQAAEVRLESLKTLSDLHISLEGAVAVTAKGRGTLDQPQLQASINSPKLTYRLAHGEQQAESLTAQLNIANRRATFSATTNMGGSLETRGSVELTGEYEAHASLNSSKIALAPLLSRYLPPEASDLEGRAEIHANLGGPLKRPSALVAQIEIPSLSLAYQNIRIENSAPLKLAYAQGRLTFERATLQGSGTSLRLEGSIPVLPALGSEPLHLDANGTLDLKILKLFYPNWDSSGTVGLNFMAQGSRSHPDFKGQVNIANGTMYPAAIPLGISNVNGDLEVVGNRLQVRRLTGQVGAGNVTVTGFITYQPNITFALALNGDSVRVRYPVGVRTVVDTDLQLTGTARAARLTGRVLIDRLSLTKEFDLLTLADRLTAPAPLSPPGSFASRLRLDVGVQSSEELSLASSKVNMQGSANLRVGGTAATPVIVGRAVVNAGEVTFRGQQYDVQQGVFDFINPYRTEPTINLTLNTKVDQYDLTMNLVGPVDRLRIHYSSVPPLPPVDIINLLTVGKTATQQGATGGSVSATIGAESVLAQSLSSAVSSRIERLVGISNLQIDPLLGGSNSEPGARLAIQQRVTRNLSFTYATDVRTTQREVIQVEYQVSRRLSLSVTRDEYGTYGIDLRAHKTF